MKYILILTTLFLSACNLNINNNLIFSPMEQFAFKSVVIVYNKAGLGTGWVVYSDSKVSGVITNLHVCALHYHEYLDGKEELPKTENIYLSNSITGLRETLTGEPIAIDRLNDICLIKINQSLPIPVLKLRKNSFKCSRNETLLTVSPYPYSLIRSPCIGQDRPLNDSSGIHYDSWELVGSFIRGQSGSPVIDSKGGVVGMLWGLQEMEGTGLSFKGLFISSNALNTFLDNSLTLLKGNK